MFDESLHTKKLFILSKCQSDSTTKFGAEFDTSHVNGTKSEIGEMHGLRCIALTSQEHRD